ncbi:efflux transporter [Dentipellis sp. KUC8613]|nr:efflux transporter [Dentipellis sp. KUC8613]
MLKSVAIIATCTSAMIINNANATAIAVLLPAAGRNLDIPSYNLQWIISAYSLSSGCFLILFGRIADLYGRKKVLIFGYIIMAAFALGCGFAQQEITLDVLRGIQGIGGAAVIPASLGILAHSFPPSRMRSVAFATFSSGGPVGGMLGFVIGGVLIQVTEPTWRTLFYLLAALGFLGAILAMVCVDPNEPSTETDRRVDWIGAFLVTTGLVLIVFVLSDAPTAPHGWRTKFIIGLLVAGVVSILLFLVWEHYLERIHSDLSPQPVRSWWAAPPLMKLSMWTRAKGRFAVMQVIAFINWCSFTCWVYWVQLYYQNYLHLTPIKTMLRILPTIIVGICCNVAVALFVGRVDVVYLVAIGALLTGCANIFFAFIVPSAPYWAFGFPSALIIVFGADFVFASGTLFIAKVSLPSEQSVGGALFQTMTQLGVAFGLSLSTIVFNGVLKTQAKKFGIEVNKEGSNAPMDAQLKAYHAAEWMGFAFGICGALLSLFLRGVGIVGHDNRQNKPSDPAFDEEKKSAAVEVSTAKTNGSSSPI